MAGLTPGWYEDRDDPTLARWFDGEQLTDHTLVIADQVPGLVPAPPSTADPVSARGPVGWAQPTEPRPPVYASPSRDAAPEPPVEDPLWWTPDDVPPRSPLDESPLPHSVREVPEPFFDRELTDEEWSRQVGWRWVWITGGGIALLLLALIGLKLGERNDNDDGDGAEVATSDADALEEAVAIAMEAADVTFFANQGFEALLPTTCAAAETGDIDELVHDVAVLDYDDTVLLRLLNGLRVGAQSLCPDAIGEQPNLLSKVHNAIIERRVPDITAPTPPSSIDPGSTSSTSTTKASGSKSTTTTRPSGTTSTTAPAATTTAPTTTVPDTTTTSVLL